MLFKIFCKVLRLICLFFSFKEKESLMFRVKCNFFKIGLNLKKIELLFFINKGIFLWWKCFKMFNKIGLLKYKFGFLFVRMKLKFL